LSYSPAMGVKGTPPRAFTFCACTDVRTCARAGSSSTISVMTPTPPMTSPLAKFTQETSSISVQAPAARGEGLGGMDKEGEKEVLRFERVRVGTNQNRVEGEGLSSSLGFWEWDAMSSRGTVKEPSSGF